MTYNYALKVFCSLAEVMIYFAYLRFIHSN